MKYILIIVLLLPLPVKADWSRADTARQLTFTTLLAADWLQTREISRNQRFTESNQILGPNPTLQQVDTYFAVSALGHYMIARSLPPKARTVWQYIWIGIEAGYVHHNYSIGVKIIL